MPPSKPKEVLRLSAALIEQAHDFGIHVTWPGAEPVQLGTCRDVNLLHSAAESPYQDFFGCEAYPGLAAKAAYLFVHLASAHVFENGNKRTAAICLDVFLLINSHYLFLSNAEVHDLAQEAASFGERGLKFPEVLESTKTKIEDNMTPLSSLRTRLPSFYRLQHHRKHIFLKMDAYQFDAPLSQPNRYA